MMIMWSLMEWMIVQLICILESDLILLKESYLNLLPLVKPAPHR